MTALLLYTVVYIGLLSLNKEILLSCLSIKITGYYSGASRLTNGYYLNSTVTVEE